MDPTTTPELPPPDIFQDENSFYSAAQLANWDHDELGALDTERLSHSSPLVVAQFLERLEVDERRVVLRSLPNDFASEVLAEMDEEDAAEVFAAMRVGRAATLLEDFDLDDAADVVAELEDEDRDRLLEELKPELAARVKDLMAYDPDSAGGIMDPDVIAVHVDMAVDEAIARVRRLTEDHDDIYYLYVVDSKFILQGIVSLRRLILAKPSQRIKEIMRTELRGICTPDTDREQVALLMAEYNLPDIIVVDHDGKLLGEVSHDDVIDVLQDEATEDMQILHGAGSDESIHDPLISSVRMRNPWLQINLVTAFIASGIIMMFERQIGSLPMLAAFMPIIASLGGNAGHQALAVAIRSLALGEIQESDNRRICFKEMVLGLVNGVGVGLVAAIVASIATGNIRVGVVIVIAMILNMGLAGLSGAFIPIILKKFNFDPAQSSSIFLTAATDIAGFFIFLSLGSWILL